MRHGKAGKKFQRNSAWRKATIRDMAKATLIRQRIKTTLARAKEARKLVDQLITIGKTGSLAGRRAAYVILCEHSLVKSLFDKIAPRFISRVGGYTRIIPIGFRRGDNAMMVFLELTEKEVVAVKPKKEKAAKKTKDVEVEEESPKVTPVAKDEEKKSSAPTKAPSRKDSGADKGKPQSGKTMMGGLQKMFRRKVGGE